MAVLSSVRIGICLHIWSVISHGIDMALAKAPRPGVIQTLATTERGAFSKDQAGVRDGRAKTEEIQGGPGGVQGGSRGGSGGSRGGG